MSDLKPEDLRIKNEDKDDFKMSLIERKNLTNEFTVHSVETHQKSLQKQKTEVDATIGIAKSMVANIERNHKKLIDSLSEEKKATVFLWQENQNIIKEGTPLQDEINAQIEKNEGYLDVIYEAFGFVKTEVKTDNDEQKPKINRDNPSGTA